MISRTRKVCSLNYTRNIILSILFRSAICAVIVNLFSVGSGNTQEFQDTKYSTNLTSIEEQNASSETLIKEKFGNEMSDISKSSSVENVLLGQTRNISSKVTSKYTTPNNSKYF